jgi:four helix bundle protein
MGGRRGGFDHERLDVYQAALDLAAAADAFAPLFGGTRKHLGWQLHRAACSVALNIAEGNARVHVRDRGRFFVIASGSALECAAIVDIAERLGIGDARRRDSIRHQLRPIVQMLIALSRPARP